jgi:hypothetical protein
MPSYPPAGKGRHLRSEDGPAAGGDEAFDIIKHTLIRKAA